VKRDLGARGKKDFNLPSFLLRVFSQPLPIALQDSPFSPSTGETNRQPEQNTLHPQHTMAKGFFVRLLTAVAVLSASVMVMAQEDDDIMPLRTHSMYMPYIGKDVCL